MSLKRFLTLLEGTADAAFAVDAAGRISGWNDAVLTDTRVNPATDRTIAGTTDPFVAQLADVADAIKGRRPPRCALADGAAAVIDSSLKHFSEEFEEHVQLGRCPLRVEHEEVAV